MDMEITKIYAYTLTQIYVPKKRNFCFDCLFLALILPKIKVLLVLFEITS